MLHKFDFVETKEKVFLTFFKPRAGEDQQDPFYENPKIEMQDNKTVTFNSETIPLFAPVTLHHIGSTQYKIEIVLLKDTPARWNGIDGKPPSIEVNEKIYETLENEVQESTIMDVLKSIYEKGDLSVKKAMDKSLEESAGTVLSTNWEDVKSRKIKPEK